MLNNILHIASNLMKTWKTLQVQVNIVATIATYRVLFDLLKSEYKQKWQILGLGSSWFSYSSEMVRGATIRWYFYEFKWKNFTY